MESSFSGADYGKFAGLHFTAKHWLDMGKDFCDTILDYTTSDPSRVNQILREFGTYVKESKRSSATGGGSDSDDS